MPTIGSNFTIYNCISNLPMKFGNRQDLFNMSDPQTWPTSNVAPSASRPVIAVMESIKELTETYEFEELKYQTPVPPVTPLNLTQGNGVVPIATLLGTIPSQAATYPQFQGQNIIDITDVYTFWMWFAGGVNQAGRTLKYRRVPTIDTYSYGITNNNQNQLGVAPPVYATRFGNNLQVGPVPDQNYQYFVRVKIRHPFPIGGSSVFVPAIVTAVISPAGVVTSLNLGTNSQGYPPSTTFPLFFTPPPSGSVATGTATSNSTGGVASVSITSGGSGYVNPPVVSTAAAAQQQVFMPDSWQEIVELCACQRLALWEGATQYIEMFEGLLRAKGIDVAQARARKAQMVRDEMHNERSMSLQVGMYTWA